MTNTILIVGFGVSGKAAAKLAARQGANVRVAETRPSAALSTEEHDLIRSLQLEASPGGFQRADFLSSDLIVVSPGVPLTAPEIVAARAKGIPVIGEMEFAFRNLPRPIPVVAITGTDGKSTVTTLVAHLLTTAGRRVFVGGNLGEPLSSLLLREAAEVQGIEAIVLEVSSFQLESIEKFAPQVAAILNIAPDHLDRYAAPADYVAAKANIMRNMGKGTHLALNRADSSTPRLKQQAVAKGIQVLEFSDEGPQSKDVWPHLPGAHNRENVAAARLIARALGMSEPIISEGIASYVPLHFRLERVGELDGVGFYNDSKATTVHATAAALRAFDNIFWIAGGFDGKEDYSPLREAVAGRVKGAFFIGQTRETMAEILEGACKTSRYTTLEKALAAALQVATAGDVILFSPACKSFDQYRDYVERGQDFNRLIASWIERGKK